MFSHIAWLKELKWHIQHERNMNWLTNMACFSHSRTKEFWMPNVGELEGMIKGRLQCHIQVLADLEWRRRRSIGEHNSHYWRMIPPTVLLSAPALHYWICMASLQAQNSVSKFFCTFLCALEAFIRCVYVQHWRLCLGINVCKFRLPVCAF